MGPEVGLFEEAPNSLCDTCSRKCPRLGYHPIPGPEKKRGPHVTWFKWHDPLPQQLLKKMAECMFCSMLMTAVRHRKEGDEYYNESYQLSVLSSQRAIKKEDGYEWEECPLISLLPTREYQHYSSPSGCTDLGFLAMIKARDEAKSVPTKAKRALDFEYINELASICAKQHGETCAFPAGPQVPNLRVIDCTTGLVVDAPDGCCYLALSYVWGEPTPAEDDGATEFRQVVRDSIDITKALGLQYLWVDRHVGSSDFSHICRDLR